MKLRLFALSCVVALLIVLIRITAAQALAVIQSYGSTGILHVGTIVKLTDKNPNAVEPVSTNNETKMFGVVVNANASPVSLSQSGTSTNAQAYVATDGDYQVLVDNQNGPINVGDYVSVSSLSGIGKKASSNDPEVIGKAITTFQGSSDSVGSSVIKSGSGVNNTVQLGLVTVNISINHNPLYTAQSNNLPSFLRSASNSIASKPVSSLRVYSGVVLLVIAVIFAGSILFSGIRSSMIAVGRNPLSRKPIIRSLIQIILTSIIILLIGIFGVYLLLKV